MTDELVLRKSVVVACPPDHAFRVFTERMSDWWPFDGHSLFDGEAPVVWEGHVGGRVLERAHDGREGIWGTVVAWDPPRSLTMTWHPGRGEETAQEVTVSFAEQDGGTRVDLVHTGWERADEPAERFASYDAGWGTVLGLFADAAAAER